ncbi:Macrolide export ATP-binding/permease protein MacB [compost metagenome]
MKKVGIAGLEHRDITQVSGGQLQRAGICRALMSHPKIIFGDEPTGALNSKSAEEIMDILSDINSEGTSVMLVTHDAKIAARTERIMFMRDGKIVSELLLQKFSGRDIDDRMEKVTARMREIGI